MIALELAFSVSTRPAQTLLLGLRESLSLSEDSFGGWSLERNGQPRPMLEEWEELVTYGETDTLVWLFTRSQWTVRVERNWNVDCWDLCWFPQPGLSPRRVTESALEILLALAHHLNIKHAVVERRLDVLPDLPLVPAGAHLVFACDTDVLDAYPDEDDFWSDSIWDEVDNLTLDVRIGTRGLNATTDAEFLDAVGPGHQRLASWAGKA